MENVKTLKSYFLFKAHAFKDQWVFFVLISKKYLFKIYLHSYYTYFFRRLITF